MNMNLTLLMQAAIFAVFIWACATYIWPALMRAIDTRQKQIADGLAAGEEGRHSLANAEKRIARDDDRGEDARAGHRCARRKAEERNDRAVEVTGQDRRRIGSSLPPRPRSQQEVYRAKETLRDQVADLAVAGARARS